MSEFAEPYQRSKQSIKRVLTSQEITHNEKGSKVEADVAMCPLLRLFRREESRDGDTYVPYALHKY